MKKGSVLLKCAALIFGDGSVRTRQNLYTEDGRIAAIVDTDSDDGSRQADEVIDCSRYFVTSGIVNLHAHTAMNIFKGIAEDVKPDQWFNDMIFPYESKMTPQDVYIGTKLGIAEMINNGVTAVADHYFMEEEVLRAVKDTGIRADLAPTVFGASPDYRDRLAQVRAFITEHEKDSELVEFHMGPHADYTCPPEAMGDIVDAAKAMDLPLHLHLAEEEAQVKIALEKYGVTPFGYMERFGAFDLPVLAAHGLWIREDDLKYIKDDTMFAFCPKTYMKLGSGRGGFFDLYDKLNYSFGTDGAASSNTVNPVEQARLFALLGKFLDDDGRTHPTEDMWKHLMNGHRAFRFGTGYLREGAPADLVIWDLNMPDTMAYYHPVTAILYSSTSANVRCTMVAGEILKRDGKLVMDTEELLREASEAQQALIARGKGKANVGYLR